MQSYGNHMDVNLYGCSHHSVHWGIKPPLKTPLPSFLPTPLPLPPLPLSASPPVKSANCPVNS